MEQSNLTGSCILGEHSKYLIQWEDIHYKLLYHSIILQDYDNFMEGKTKQIRKNM